MKDIYKTFKKEEIKKEQSIKTIEKFVDASEGDILEKQKQNALQEIQESVKTLGEKLQKIGDISKVQPIIKVLIPETQNVVVQNPTPKADPIIFPDVQKVSFETIPQELIAKPIDLLPLIEKLNEILKKEQPKFPKKIEISNPTPQLQLPMGKGDIPGEADPTEYVNVRLTNGKKFYNALADAYVAAAKGSKDKPWATFPIDALSNTAVVINTTFGEFGGYYYYNPNASPVYIQVFKKANPTVGTDAHNLVFGIPANAGANIEFKRGVDIGRVFSVAATTGATNSTAPASPIVTTILYS